MVLICFDLVWERSVFVTVPHGLAWKKETETAHTRFWSISRILIRLHYDFDMILICVQDMFKIQGTQKREITLLTASKSQC